jgi:hypothetical protein
VVEAPLTGEQAHGLFDALAAKGHEIAFRVRAEGCECRAQLMIEHLQALGIEPRRAWVLAMDRPLVFPDPANPRQFYNWHNHVAPTVAVEDVAYGVLVLDPSTQTGPAVLTDWTRSMGPRQIEVSSRGLSLAEIQQLRAERGLSGQGLDAIVFHLKLGEPPIPDQGGSGFRFGPDPEEGPSAFARATMQRLLGS